MMSAPKTYWLIGASEGLGRALAQKLSAEGHHLILSARSKERLETLDIAGATNLPLDVTDAKAAKAACAQLPAIDGVIYCAGAYEPMHSDAWDTDTALKMMDVNTLGAMRILPELLPQMRARNRGHIVLIGSLAAYYGLPASIGYSASKAALMSLAETLYLDLKKTNIKVQIINPGFIETRLTQKNTFKMAQIMSPERAADHVLRAMARNRFRTAFPRPFAWLFPLLRRFPDTWVRALF